MWVVNRHGYVCVFVWFGGWFCMMKEFCPFRLAGHDYHNKRMSSMPADSFDMFGNSRLADGQPTFATPLRECLLTDRRTCKRNKNVSQTWMKVWEIQCENHSSASHTTGKRAAEGTERGWQKRKKQEVPLWTSAARVVMVTEHLIEVRDWEYNETIRERGRKRAREGTMLLFLSISSPHSLH